MKAMREALTSLGYNCSLYAGHSFRIGAATVAAQHGVLGEWDAKRGARQCGSYNDRRVEASRRERANRENTGRGMTGERYV